MEINNDTQLLPLKEEIKQISPPTSNTQSSWIFRFIDAMSLSGAVIILFFSITIFGIYQGNEKVWTTGMTALTTFVSGKKLGQYESSGPK